VEHFYKVGGGVSCLAGWLSCMMGMEKEQAEAPDTTYNHELDNLQFYLKFCFLWQIVRER
jgi:hypothetical protein